MIHPNDSGRIDQHQGRDGACSVSLEIRVVQWRGHWGNGSIKLLPNPIDVRLLDHRARILAASHVTIKFSRTNYHQPLRRVSPLQVGDDLRLRFTIDAPMRPEK